MHVQTITIDEFFAHPCAQELLDAYALESAIEGMPRPSADAAAYKVLESTGALTMLAAVDGEVLLGFITVLVYRNPHYSALLGVVESYFVAPACRKTGAGIALRQEAEALVARAGGLGLLISAPSGGKLAQAMQGTPGYRETNRVFFKRLAS